MHVPGLTRSCIVPLITDRSSFRLPGSSLQWLRLLVAAVVPGLIPAKSIVAPAAARSTPKRKHLGIPPIHAATGSSEKRPCSPASFLNPGLGRETQKNALSSGAAQRRRRRNSAPEEYPHCDNGGPSQRSREVAFVGDFAAGGWYYVGHLSLLCPSFCCFFGVLPPCLCGWWSFFYLLSWLLRAVASLQPLKPFSIGAAAPDRPQTESMAMQEVSIHVRGHGAQSESSSTECLRLWWQAQK